MRARAEIWILAGGLFVVANVLWKLESDLDAARDSYRQERHAEAERVRLRVAEGFRRIYHGMRTMARLPGVRSIDRYARNLSPDARQTAQEIYNNLASEISVSELYIVPVDFDPDRIDPNTGRLEEPITTFDELIVGRNADLDADSTQADEPLEEIEIYEYRLMRSQIEQVRAQIRDESQIRTLSYPAVLGPQVVTCDNTYYSPSRPDDRDRTGLVYSLPFFSPAGELKGIVSAVLLIRVLQAMLPGEGYAILGDPYALEVGLDGDPIRTAARGAIDRRAPDAERIYSELLTLDVLDHGGRWRLFVAGEDEAYWARAAVRSARFSAFLALVCTVVLCGGLYLWLRTNRSVMRRLDQARRRAEASSTAKSRFLANVSHEVRTPMTALLGYLELLHDEGVFESVSDSARTALGAIDRSASFLLGLINDLLETTLVERGEISIRPSPCNPAEIAQDVFDRLTRTAGRDGLAVSLQVAETLPSCIETDPMRLQQVLQNLLANALKFTDEGSVELHLSARRNDGSSTELVIAVVDTGPGIAPADRDKIFEPFEQVDSSLSRRHDGLGLGLAITSRIVEALGGRIDLLTEPGCGSTFRVQLPVREVTSEGAHEQADASRVLLRGRILLVEDSPDNQRLISRILERAGLEVHIAENGRRAVERLCEEPDRFDLVLMDMQMPELDGYEATRILRQHGCELPIIALTAHAMSYDRRICLEAGCSDYATKPLERTQLLGLVDTWLSKEPNATPAS